jgi:hypothetical protein
MAEDRIQICHGIEEVNKDKFTNFLASCELPLLGKIKSVFLIEQFMGEIVLRSRLCEFALYDDVYQGLSTVENFSRCQECDAFQMDHEFDPVIKGNLKSEQMYSSGEEEKSDLKGENMYQRVYHQTTVADGETMAVFDQAKNLYDTSSLAHLNAKKSKRKGKKNANANKLEPNANIEIKSEPCETLNNEESVLGFQSDTNEMVSGSTNTTSFNTELPNKIGEDNVLPYGDVEVNKLNKNGEHASLFEGYECKMEDGVHDAPVNSNLIKRRKRINTDTFGIYNPPNNKLPSPRRRLKR